MSGSSGPDIRLIVWVMSGLSCKVNFKWADIITGLKKALFMRGQDLFKGLPFQSGYKVDTEALN